METIPSLSGLAPNSPLPCDCLRQSRDGYWMQQPGEGRGGAGRGCPTTCSWDRFPLRSKEGGEATRREHPHCLWTSSETRAGAPDGAQADSHTSGVPPRTVPPTLEPAGLQASNSQLQALLSVPRKQRRVLSFTRLEGRSCQHLRLSYQLLGAGSRWRDGTPDREQTFQGRRGRKSLRGQPPSPSHAKMEQTYPPLPLSHPHKSQEEIFTLG